MTPLADPGGGSSYDVIWTTVFADAPDGGNPCPVVFGADSRSDAELQRAAHEFGVETVFVLPPTAAADVRLRYFVPLHEMQMCVHATIAATIVLAELGRVTASPVRVETLLGTLDVEWDLATSTAVVSQFPPVFGPELTELNRVGAALRIGKGQILAARAVSTSRAKLMVELPDEATLDALEPDFDLLWQVCDELDVTGFYPFTRSAGGVDVAARQFPCRAGYPEDPATGVAACGLASYLAVELTNPGWVSYRIAQGRAMGRPSMIVAEARRDTAGAIIQTRVGGRSRRTAAPPPL